MSAATPRPDEQPCALHDLPWCDVCVRAKAPRQPIPRDRGPQVSARYAGNCACCGERYAAGSLITMSEADSGWVLTDHLDPTGPAQPQTFSRRTDPAPPRNAVDFSDLWE